ncbi:preprotein translocase subunit (ATPase) [Buchnera aphidicola (Cinara tujafilina)]|uniref:Protein translocase subunit SecA n=1 Tax=Buchnera aphidicola (Cinara tujafilina) TaxID=261317 RepID=F7WZ69_9GAMM|nr:preprotein translocase subunit SecA [Buchnera aphidicola]AEH39723.1 preprotein translocase subunit (ATPase) [Buchnera aphidicola (Cinara tujafilina)]
MVSLSDAELKKKTIIFKNRLKKGETLEQLLPEAFAVVREASKRVFGMRHFDVQLLGGIVLHQNSIAEMRTGEGKTLTATLPVYLNALEGKGVHVVTMNDYLAKRDGNKNRILFNFLGLTVGINISKMSKAEKRKAYSSDITYGTNHEYGFDYLRDNMVFCSSKKVQRELYYALVDEVDSILIDEARTPLIISGPVDHSNSIYIHINKLVRKLTLQIKDRDKKKYIPGDFFIDRKARQVYLTEKGMDTIEKLLVSYNFLTSQESLYSPKNIVFIHHILLALKAHYIFFNNIDYIIKIKNIMIVDEHTGRIMPGRRWSEGLHQAIEAKEHVLIQQENQTLASITLQNYFRLYKKLSGMTGTAITEEFEFRSIYNLETVVIPTNKPMIRNDMSDVIYLSCTEKYKAIVAAIKDCVLRKQPVLIGTVSIEKSELLSSFLKKNFIKHNILNAKFHAQEADIIAQAGQLGAVTIATNMAGRGTDIVLGGNFDSSYIHEKNNINIKKRNFLKKRWKKNNALVIRSGGLHIIGTERHESRRIDNQLRGRAGRQGDPGSSRFYLSLEDPLLQLFLSDKMIYFMKLFGIKKEESIEHPWINTAIENAQKKVENQNFDVRKSLLEYDNIINEQRKVIYHERNKIIDSSNLSSYILVIFSNQIKNFLKKNIIRNDLDFNILKKFKNLFFLVYLVKKFLQNKLLFSNNINHINNYIVKIIQKDYIQHTSQISIKYSMIIEKYVILQIFDQFWRDHLNSLDFLRKNIYLRSYAQKDPTQEYKRESFSMFASMLESIKKFIIKSLLNIFYKNFETHKYILIKFIDSNDFKSLRYFITKLCETIII